MHKFVILGEVASKKNNKRILYKGSGSYRTPFIASSKRYVAWNKQAKEQLFLQKRNFTTDNCRMIITFFYGTLRDKDADNGTSSVFDTLKDVGIIKDDTWKIVGDYFVFSKYDKNNGRVEVEIYDKDEPIDINSRIILANKPKIDTTPELKQLELDFN